MRADTRARVLEAVGALGYTPHFGARALATNRTDTVGAIIPTMENAIFARGLQALQEALAEAGVTLLVASSGYDPERELARIRTLIGRGVDGLVLIGEARPEESYRLIAERALPVVLAWCHRSDGPHPTVGFDNRDAARQMAERVLAHGHRRIAMIAGVTAWNDRAALRVAGVRDALAAAGLTLAPPLLVEATYEPDAAGDAARALLALPDRPTAILCGNDVQAAGAMRAVRELGLAIPHDLSVTGFDDIELASLLAPPLTTVHVPHRRMGQAAATLLLAMRGGLEPGRSVAIGTKIIERGSLAPPPVFT